MFNRAKRQTMSLWGDGFADDGTFEFYSVERWDYVSSDEYIRFFPSLVAGKRGLAECIRLHLVEQVAARWWRLRYVHKVPSASVLRTMSLEKADVLGRECHDTLFKSQSLADRLRGLLARSDQSGSDEDQAALDLLDGILSSVQEARLRPSEAHTTAAFAFFSGIHPAYLWPDTHSHERDSTAGWLGVVRRGRSALMPLDVAEYLVDAIAQQSEGGWAVRDAQLRELIGTPRDVVRLAMAARDRCHGKSIVVRRAPRWPTGLQMPLTQGLALASTAGG